MEEEKTEQKLTKGQLKKLKEKQKKEREAAEAAERAKAGGDAAPETTAEPAGKGKKGKAKPLNAAAKAALEKK